LHFPAFPASEVRLFADSGQPDPVRRGGDKLSFGRRPEDCFEGRQLLVASGEGEASLHRLELWASEGIFPGGPKHCFRGVTVVKFHFTPTDNKQEIVFMQKKMNRKTSIFRIHGGAKPPCTPSDPHALNAKRFGEGDV